MMRYVFIVLALLLSSAGIVEAKPKVFKEAAAAIKNKSNLQASRNALMAHALDSATSDDERARAYAVAAEVNRTINAVENEKLYLKKNYDTTVFYSSIFDLYRCVLKCDSVEVAAGGKIRYRKAGAQMLQSFRANLLNGAKWHLMGTRYKEAYDFFDLYNNTVKTDLHDFGEDEQRYKIAYWSVLCSTATGNHRGTLHYVDSAMMVGAYGEYLHRYKVEALWALGDTAAWIEASEVAMRKYVHDTYFFLHLTDYMRAQHKYDLAMAYAVEMTEKQPDTTVYRYSRCLIYLETEQWEECIQAADDVLAHDSLYADAWYNKGLSFVKRALLFEPNACLDLTDPKCVEDRKYLKGLYEEARIAMERYRALRPEDNDRWAPPLYHIYLNLNMGKEFGEVEKALK